MGSYSLIQGIFLTQGKNPSLLHCRQILYQQRIGNFVEVSNFLRVFSLLLTSYAKDNSNQCGLIQICTFLSALK